MSAICAQLSKAACLYPAKSRHSCSHCAPRTVARRLTSNSSLHRSGQPTFVCARARILRRSASDLAPSGAIRALGRYCPAHGPSSGCLVKGPDAEDPVAIYEGGPIGSRPTLHLRRGMDQTSTPAMGPCAYWPRISCTFSASSAAVYGFFSHAPLPSAWRAIAGSA